MVISGAIPVLAAAWLFPAVTGRADSAAVSTAANTLITTATAQTSPYTLTSGYNPSLGLTLANAEKWTNLPGTPPNDGARVGPVIGGGSVTYTTYELSGTVSSGQSVSPRQAALNTAAAATSAVGYTELNEIRYADSVLSASGGGTAYNYSDYRADVLNNANGTLSSSVPFMIKFAGHHLAYAFTYNFPKFNGSAAYTSASPMFLGLEPPDYHSTGTDNQGSTSSTASNAFIFGTNNGTAGSFLAMYPGTSGNTLTTVTAASAAATLPARTNVTATAIGGATGAAYTISPATAADNGFYFCKVTNTGGTTNSNTVALTIALTANGNLYQNTGGVGTSPAPVITTQPQSATVTTGSSVTFNVAATSSTALSYQWYKIATTHRAAMETQRAAASLLAAAVQADGTLKSSALLSGTFSDIVQGVAGSSGDTGFPATYPTGTTGRGVLFSSMTSAQQATLKPLIKGFIEAYVANASNDAAATLLADYESDAAINASYVGYANGSGAADSTGVTRCNFDATINQEQTPTNSQHSYIRVDGPRAWVELVVQNAVLYNTQKFVHYHSIYRDKLSDYGGEFGGFLNGASTSSGYTGATYTRPSFTTQPASVNSGTSATFTAAATANVAGSAVTPAYQWYSVATGLIGGATASAYATNTAGSYYVTATTAYGTAASNVATFTASATAATPAITTQPASQSALVGGSVTFAVAATTSDAGTLSYQWYFGGAAISGASGSSYTINPVAAANAGSYSVVVTNTLGSSTTAGTSNTATLTVVEPFSAYLSNYGLSGASATADSDNDGLSNLVEFVLGGNPTVSDAAILPTVTYASSSGTPTLVYSFYSVKNLGSVTWTVEYSVDLTTWNTAVNGTNGVTITTTPYDTGYNLNTVTIPDSTGTGRTFTRLRATLPANATQNNRVDTLTGPSSRKLR